MACNISLDSWKTTLHNAKMLKNYGHAKFFSTV
jgi:hypothetical protein